LNPEGGDDNDDGGGDDAEEDKTPDSQPRSIPATICLVSF
jgi:hypothetical protein